MTKRVKLTNSPALPGLNSRCFLNNSLPLLSAPPPLPPPLSANVWKLILTFQVFRKASSAGDNRCGRGGRRVPGREGVNGPVLQFASVTSFIAPCLN